MAAHHNVNGEQLKMFMTPREIHSQYQPLDNDRLEVEDDRAGDRTQRPYTTQGFENEYVPSEGQYRRQASHEGVHTEDSDALWERKLDESWDDGLHVSIDESGVKSPIRLGQQKGSEGKRQIVGGHHRLASATDIDDQQLVPVLHDESFGSALRGGQQWRKSREGYPYT